MCRQIQVDTHSKTQVPIPARDYDIDPSESEMACHFSKSDLAFGEALNSTWNEETQLTKLLKSIQTHDPDQHPL